MIFLYYLAFAAELIALSVGVGLLVWAYRNEGKCIVFTKVFGYIIMIAAIIILICSIFHAATFLSKGCHRSMMAPMMMHGMKHRMQQRMMQQQQDMMEQPNSQNSQQ